MVVNTAADTLITQMSGQQFDGICLALAGGLFCTDVGELMISGKEDAVSDIVSHLTDVLEQAVRFLSQHFAEVFIPCVSATGWGSATTAPDDLATLLDRLAYQMLRARLADLIESGRVAIEISQTSSLPSCPATTWRVSGTTTLLRETGTHSTKTPASLPMARSTAVVRSRPCGLPTRQWAFQPSSPFPPNPHRLRPACLPIGCSSRPPWKFTIGTVKRNS
jgi:hypothetical protein